MKPYYQDASVKIYHADCREVLSAMKPGSVDLVLTDPPYGIGLDTSNRKYHNRSGIARPAVTGDDAPFDPSPLLALNTRLILWGGNNYAHRLPAGAGWLCWVKTARNGARIRQADMELAWTNFVRRPQCFRHLWIGAYRDSESGERALHPTQKPLAVMAWCLTLAPDANRILDPYMGSGTTLRVVKDAGRKAIGIEIEEKYCEIAAKRMEQSTLGLSV